MPTTELTAVRAPMDAGTRTAFLVVDTESVPDGRLLSQVKYPADDLDPAAAIERARDEARQSSYSGSDFLPVSFQYPVAGLYT